MANEVRHSESIDGLMALLFMGVSGALDYCFSKLHDTAVKEGMEPALKLCEAPLLSPWSVSHVFEGLLGDDRRKRRGPEASRNNQQRSRNIVSQMIHKWVRPIQGTLIGDVCSCKSYAPGARASLDASRLLLDCC